MPQRDAAIKRHLPLALHTAHRYLRSSGCRGGADPDDVCSVATIGLIHGFDRYDPARGHCFSTYAVPTIQGAIRHDQRDHWRPVHMPRRALELQQRATRLQRLHQAQGKPRLNPDQLCGALGCSRQQLQQSDDAWRLQTVASLDALPERVRIEPLAPNSDDPMREWWLAHWESLSPADQDLAEGLWLEPVPRRQLARRLGISLKALQTRELQLLDQLRQSAMASTAAMVV